MVNKWIGIGRIGSDPEVRDMNNSKVAKLNLAVSEKYKNRSGEMVDETTWLSVICWNQLSDICEKYVKKGDLLYIEGKIKNRSYDNKDGVKVYVTEIIADSLRMLSSKQEAKSPESKIYTAQPALTNQPKPVASGGTSNELQKPPSYNAHNQQDDLPF
jgi:single-strand DNA-binding protein